VQRIKLIRYGALTVTPDTRDALEALGNKANEVGWRVGFEPSPWAADEGVPRYLSLSPAGRCFEVEALHDQITAPTACLAALWSMTVPLGLTPWNALSKRSYIGWGTTSDQSMGSSALAQHRPSRRWACLVSASNRLPKPWPTENPRPLPSGILLPATSLSRAARFP